MRQTARNEMARRQKAHCVYDEFTEDTEKNRILKATARILAASESVDPARRRDLKRCLVYMGGISDVGTARIDWKRLKYDRNNSGYLMLMNVCYMVLNGLVLSTDAGDNVEADFQAKKVDPKGSALANALNWYDEDVSLAVYDAYTNKLTVSFVDGSDDLVLDIEDAAKYVDVTDYD